MQTGEQQTGDKVNLKKMISGFSKFTKLEKIDYLSTTYLSNTHNPQQSFASFWHSDGDTQKIFDEFTENSISNYYIPYGVAPNFLINDKLLAIPMVIEESSVVAACSKAAKFWLDRGGFQCEVIDTKKVGQVHFKIHKGAQELKSNWKQIKEQLRADVAPLLSSMESRGGGLSSIELKDKTAELSDYYQLWCEFETCDAMGANFINSVLEALGKSLQQISINLWPQHGEDNVQVIMAILSNYTPDCKVVAKVECDVEDLNEKNLGMSAAEFAEKFCLAVKIAEIDPNRATTHNKGIFNGIDAVVLATGNDFRAIEACGHTYAARDGQYRSLTKAKVEKGKFHFSLEIPLALGTVGGLTSLHPMAKMSLDLLGRPNASELMEICAAVGLAQNFAAVKSLTTSGIQKGHMKMHLMNILNHLEASDKERELSKSYFAERVISFKDVRDYLATLRNYQ